MSKNILILKLSVKKQGRNDLLPLKVGVYLLISIKYINITIKIKIY